LTCSNVIDYGAVEGDVILPFKFTLNDTDSVLDPGPGEYQKFCYDVVGDGQNTSEYKDLSHFLLGICPDITRSDIIDITVVINGVEQTIIWGTNVEIKTEEKPDPPTGCIGLKIDFPLNKVTGKMEVCITLAEPYAVGPVDVCVFGGNTTKTGLAICGPFCEEGTACESVFYQEETVCVPVTVTPFATPGEAKAFCCGDPVVNQRAVCAGSQTSCTFTVTQTLCIEIPIAFGADIVTGSAVVNCGIASDKECECLNEAQSMSKGKFIFSKK
jgi:hypothetical protein